MLLKKDDYNKLVKRIESLEKENKALKTKYEGKINGELNMESYRKTVDEKAKEEVEAYKKNLDALVSKDLNYGFLKQLVNAASKGTIIEVKLKEGNTLVIRKEVKPDVSDLDLYSIMK
jgi:hypothetical protein